MIRASLNLQQQLFTQWHQWKDGTIVWPQLQQRCQSIRQSLEATLLRAVNPGCERGDRLLHQREALWTFLEKEGIEPANNLTESALHQSVIQGKISHDVQSASGAVGRSRLLTATTTLRQQGRDVWQFLGQV